VPDDEPDWSRLCPWDRAILETLLCVEGGFSEAARQHLFGRLNPESDVVATVLDKASVYELEHPGTSDVDGFLLTICGQQDPHVFLMSVSVRQRFSCGARVCCDTRLAEFRTAIERLAAYKKAEQLVSVLKSRSLSADAEADLLDELVAMRRQARCLYAKEGAS
jgi:hypothetical protein